MRIDRIRGALAMLALLVTAPLFAQQSPPHAAVNELMSKALVEAPGKELEMISVEYPPGAVDPVHRHDAYAFVYVLEGHIEMGLRGGKVVRLGPGETFYEGPHDIHTVGRNASATEPARFVVFLVKNQGAPVFTPIE